MPRTLDETAGEKYILRVIRMRSGGDILSGFKVMFWGFLFFFDFRIQGFDVLPDIIGYWLIYTGAGDLISHSSYFTMVRKYALPLTIVSIFDIYQIQKPIEQFSVDPFVLLFSFIGLLITIVDLMLVFNLCYGIVEMARAVGNSQLSSNAEVRWKLSLRKGSVLYFNSHWVNCASFSGNRSYSFIYHILMCVGTYDGAYETS
jgi:hypothetical protein